MIDPAMQSSANLDYDDSNKTLCLVVSCANVEAVAVRLQSEAPSKASSLSSNNQTVLFAKSNSSLFWLLR